MRLNTHKQTIIEETDEELEGDYTGRLVQA